MLFKFSDHSQSVALQWPSCFQFPLQQLLYLPEPLLFCIFEANYLAYESVITAGRAIYAGCFLRARVYVNCRKSNFIIPARA